MAKDQGTDFHTFSILLKLKTSIQGLALHRDDSINILSPLDLELSIWVRWPEGGVNKNSKTGAVNDNKPPCGHCPQQTGSTLWEAVPSL